MPYQVNDLDINNFLEDFDIDHDHEITILDFKGIDKIHFDVHHESELIKY